VCLLPKTTIFVVRKRPRDATLELRGLDNKNGATKDENFAFF